MKFIAIIPARQDSKRIKNKNTKILNGKPLIYWTLKKALKCKYFSKVAVTTDSKKIFSIASKFKKTDIIKRPKKLSKDNTEMASVIKHVLKFYKNKNQHFDAAVILQPTSPLRKVKTLNFGCKLFKKKNYDTLISVEKVDHKSVPKRLFQLNKKKMDMKNFYYPYNLKNNFFYKLDGGVLFIKRINKLKNHLLSGNTCFIEVKYPESLDIDTMIEFEQVKKFYKGFL